MTTREGSVKQREIIWIAVVLLAALASYFLYSGGLSSLPRDRRVGSAAPAPDSSPVRSEPPPTSAPTTAPPRPGQEGGTPGQKPQNRP
jgi:hypothetical protein